MDGYSPPILSRKQVVGSEFNKAFEQPYFPACDGSIQLKNHVDLTCYNQTR